MSNTTPERGPEGFVQEARFAALDLKQPLEEVLAQAALAADAVICLVAQSRQRLGPKYLGQLFSTHCRWSACKVERSGQPGVVSALKCRCMQSRTRLGPKYRGQLSFIHCRTGGDNEFRSGQGLCKARVSRSTQSFQRLGPRYGGNSRQATSPLELIEREQRRSSPRQSKAAHVRITMPPRIGKATPSPRDR